MGPQANLPAPSPHATRSGLAAVPRWTPPTLSLVPGPLGSGTHRNRSGPPQSSVDSPPWKNTELCRTRVWPPKAQVTDRRDGQTGTRTRVGRGRPGQEREEELTPLWASGPGLPEAPILWTSPQLCPPGVHASCTAPSWSRQPPRPPQDPRRWSGRAAGRAGVVAL